MGKFADIANGSFFKANGVNYQKIDDLCYIDPNDPGIEHMINPMFEQTIGEKVVPQGEVDITAKFIVDPNTRVMKPNPNYKENSAVTAFAEMWGSGLFDCGPEDYAWMAESAVARIRELEDLKKAPVAKKPAKKKAAKKATKKAAAKKATKKR